MWRVCGRAGLRGAPEALAVTAGRVGWRYGLVGVGEVGAGVMSMSTLSCTPLSFLVLTEYYSTGPKLPSVCFDFGFLVLCCGAKANPGQHESDNA